MARFSIPPPGVLKINVHGTTSRNQSPNGFYTGIGVVYRDSNGALKHLTIGVIPKISPLDNQLWAIFTPLKRAFELGYRDVFLETDNLKAFLTIKNFYIGPLSGVYDLASQIYIYIKDERWSCIISYVYPVRNKVSRFLSRLGKKVFDQLYTLNMTVGGVEEFLALDMGIRFDDPDYQDVVIPMETLNLIDFDVELPSDRTTELGLGQVNEPRVMILDREVDAAENLKEAMMEEALQGGNTIMNGYIFYGDELLVEVA